MMRLYSVSGFYYVVSQLVCMDTTGPCYTMAMKHYCAKASQSVAYLNYILSLQEVKESKSSLHELE